MVKKNLIQRRHIIQAFLLISLIISSGFLIGPLKTYTQSILTGLKTGLVAEIENISGLYIEYGDLSPSFLSALVIKDIRVFASDDIYHEEPLLYIEDVRVRYDPMKLFVQRKSPHISDIISSIILNKPSLKYDLDSELFSFSNNSSLSRNWLSSLNTSFKIRNGTFNLTSRDFTLSGNKLKMDWESGEQEKTIKLSAVVDLKLSDTESLLSVFHFGVGLEGSGSHDYKNIQLKTSVQKLTTELFELADQTFDLVYNGGDLELSKIQDSIPMNLKVLLNPSDYSLHFDCEMADFRINEILKMKITNSDFDFILSTPFTGKGQLSYLPETEKILYGYQGQLMLNHPSLPEAVFLDTELTGNDDSILISTLDARFESLGTIGFSGLYSFEEMAPAGVLSAQNFKIMDNAEIDGIFLLEKKGLFYTAESEQCRFSGIDFSNASLVANFDSDIYSLSLKLKQENGGSLASHIFLFPPDHRNQGLLQGEISIDSLQINQFSPLIESLSLSEVDQSLPANSRISLESDFQADMAFEDLSLANLSSIFPQFKIRLNSLDFSLPGMLDLVGRGQFDQDYFYFISQSAQLGNEQISLDCQGKQDYSGWDSLFRITHRQTDYDMHIWQESDRLFLLKGSYGINGSLMINSESDYFAKLSFNQLPVNSSLGHLSISGDTELSASLNFWQVNLQDLTLRLSESPYYHESLLGITAVMDPESLDIMNLNFDDSYNRLSGAGRLNYQIEDSYFQGWLNLSGEQGREKINLVYNITPEQLKTRVVMDNILLNRVPGDELNGRVSVEVNSTGPINDPVVSGTFKTQNLSYRGSPVQLGTKFSLDRYFWQLSDLSLFWQNQEIENGVVLADFSGSKLSGSAFYKGMLGENKLNGAFSLVSTFEAENILQNPSKLLSSDFEANLNFDELFWNDYSVYPQSRFVIKREDNLWELRDASRFVAGYNHSNGRLSVNTIGLFPIEISANGSLVNKQLDFNVNHLDIDMKLINYFMPKDPFIAQHFALFREGHLKGSLRVNGDIEDPDIYGILYARDLLVDTPYIYSDIDRTNIDIQISGKQLNVQEFKINSGEGSILASGNLQFSRWGIDSYRLDVKAKPRESIPRSRGMPIYYPLPGIVLDGFFKGDLVIKGDKERGGLSAVFNIPALESYLGEVREVNIPVNKTVDYPFDVDISFVAGSDIVFLLPSKEIPVLKAVAAPNQVIELKYQGEAQIFTFRGGLVIKSGEIFYFDRNFSLTEGSIIFDETGDNFNPRLYASAEINTSDSDGNAVSVALVLDNPVLDEYIPQFYSVPNLSEGEILALFGQSLIPFGETDESLPSAVVASLFKTATESRLINPIEENIKSSFNLDTVSIKTDIIENAILAGMSESERSSESGTDQITRFFQSDNTSIIVGKYIGKNLFATSGLYINAGTDNTIAGNMAIRPSFGLEFQTPFFTLDWTYDKKDNDDYFTNDNSLSLKWQYSF